MQLSLNHNQIKKVAAAVPMRSPRLKTVVLAVVFLLLLRYTFFRNEGRYDEEYDASGLSKNDIRVDTFAGSDIVIYKDSPRDALYLQGFNGAPFQIGTRFTWHVPDNVNVDTSLGSILQVNEVHTLPVGVYPFTVTVTNAAGGMSSATTSVHVVNRQSYMTPEEKETSMQVALSRRIIVTLPQNEVSLAVLDAERERRYRVQSYDWIKESGSPHDGQCKAKGRVGECVGLAEGVYRYTVVLDTASGKMTVPIIIAVYPPKLRIYDHSSRYPKNKALLPVYIKAEPVVPECDVDPDFKQPVVDEALLLKHLKARAVNNTIVLGFTGDSYLALARNWFCSVKKQLGRDNYLVVSFDTKSRDSMLEMERSEGGDEMAVYFDEVLLKDKKMNFRPRTKNAEQAWKEIMSVKTTVIETITRHGYNVFVMDADTVLLQNPFNYLWSRAGDCDIQWQADGKDKFKWEDLQSRTHFNAGVYFARSTPKLQGLYGRWLDAYTCRKGRREQHALTIVLHNTFRGKWTLHNPEQEKKYVPDDIIKMCYLNPQLFPDGGYFVFNDKYRAAFDDSKQMLLHANNLQQDEVAKKNALQQHNAWFLQEDDHTCKR
eukprot:comp19540_c0_seq1/m.22882 comp19540_c0_seq1/g.22882  ORF comp19540_c0_seq1/g.22882 comp19540_c0_seq1/m.22882 type:complete len:600 (-) comp19540_c0_seq1:1017-2816(-)